MIRSFSFTALCIQIYKEILVFPLSFVQNIVNACFLGMHFSQFVEMFQELL